MSLDTKPAVSLIGTGMMGAPMAVHLATVADLTLFDLKREAAEAAAGSIGAKVAGSLAEAGENAEIVITMLPNAEAVRMALFGPDGLAEALKPGSVVVDMSSSFPPRTQEAGAELKEKGVALLDAPVSGGVRRAISGSLAIMLGGDDAAALDRAQPVLESMGKVTRTGPLGSGHALKCLNNYLSASGLRAACEAVIVGRAFGLDPEVMIDVVNTATGRNNATEVKFKGMILDERFEAGFSLDLMTKDLKTAADLSAALGLHPPGLEAETGLWLAAQQDLPAGSDHTAIFKFVEALTGKGD